MQALTTNLYARFMLITNEVPRLADASGALASRMLILKLTRSFLGKEDRGLTGRLLAELPSILLWPRGPEALAGARLFRPARRRSGCGGPAGGPRVPGRGVH